MVGNRCIFDLSVRKGSAFTDYCLIAGTPAVINTALEVVTFYKVTQLFGQVTGFGCFNHGKSFFRDAVAFFAFMRAKIIPFRFLQRTFPAFNTFCSIY